MKTTKYILKEIKESDIQNVYKGLSDPEITKYYDVHFSTLEETKEQMDWYYSLKEDGTGLWWGIYDELDNQFCGAGGFNNLDKQHKKAEIGLWLLKEYWGNQIFKKAMLELFKKGFVDLNLNRIEAYVVSNNINCKNALKKTNFTYEGTMRESEIKDNKKINVDCYAILRSEWI